MDLTNSSSGGHVKSAETAEIFWATVWFVVPFTVLVANALTIIIFTMNRHLRRRSIYCLVNLAVADLVVGFGTLISNAAVLSIFGLRALVDKRFLYHKSTPVLIQTSVYYFTMNTTMLALIVVALERMSATLWPLRHRTLKSSVYVFFIMLPWLCSSMIGIGSAFNDQNKRNYLGSPWIAFVTLILCLIYITIYIKVKSRKSLPQIYTQRLSQKENRLVTTVLLVTIASICTWTPIGVILLIRDINVIPVPYQAHFSATVMLVTNSLVNPVIYVFRIREFRKALKEIVCRCIPKRNSNEGDSTQMYVISKSNVTVSDK